MASTPSASALSAVLRCRGNIWTRNPSTKRPANSVYSLGMAGGVLRDSPAERTRSNQAPAWEAFLQGERVVVGRRLNVACKSPRVDELMFLKLGVLCRSNSCSVDAPQHLWKQQDEENIKNNTVQANGQIQSPTDFTSTKDASSSGQRVTEDRPD
ncbi:hypothetical protein D5F01_LYC13036 [Larimichthys crocea]|uniref:Uncharacterized protein n=1 Tax=Larimichthys crocea TaxID=215358 RepID=A0A6G0ID82_LARCR|nr:hypothetical protein D5F01_LYC13036 [Larimichthys crocea]